MASSVLEYAKIFRTFTTGLAAGATSAYSAPVDCLGCDSVLGLFVTGTVTAGGQVEFTAEGAAATSDSFVAYATTTVGIASGDTTAYGKQHYAIEILEPKYRYLRWRMKRKTQNSVLLAGITLGRYKVAPTTNMTSCLKDYTISLSPST